MPIPLLLFVASALAGDPNERGCDLSDAAVVKAFNDGVTSLNGGDLPDARRLFSRVLKKQPDCLLALEMAGEVALREVRAEETDAIRRGLTLYPDAPQFPMLACRLMFAAQRFDDSLLMARLAMSLAPDDVEAVSLEQMALLRLGRYVEASAALDTAKALNPHTAACFRLDIHRDQREFEQARSLVPSCESSPHEAIRVFALTNLAIVQGEDTPLEGDLNPTESAAMRAFRAERYAEAERLFAEQLKNEGWNVWARINRATCLVLLDRDHEAAALMQELFGAEAWVTVHGGGQLSGVLTKGTELAFEKSMKHALAMLVRVLVRRERLEEAATALRKAEGRFGRVPELLGPRIYLETATSGAAAWGTADAALASHPKDADIVGAVGELAFRHPEGLNPANLALLARVSPGSVRYNTLAGLSNSKRYAECLAFAAAAKKGIEAASLVTFRSTAYSCAARAEDLAALDAYYDVADPEPDGWSVALHASLLHEASRGAEATLLATRALDLEGGAGEALVVLGRMALAESRFDEVVRLATDKRGDARSSLALGIDLYNAQRFDDARRATVRLSCKAYDGDRAECDRFLDALKEAP